MKATRKTGSPIERFWAKVAVGDPDQCWEWQGSRDRTGYGHIYIDGRLRPAHRYALHLATGLSLDSELVACHACDNPPCCNPAHLFAGTQSENITDMWRKGRGRRPETTVRGADHPASKLNDRAVRLIRERHASGARQVDLALEFGVSKRLILKVVKREAWKHVA